MTALPTYAAALQEILDAIEIHSPRSFSFAGTRIDMTDDLPGGSASPETADAVLEQRLVPYLYHRCHCRALASGPVSAPARPHPNTAFVRRLQDANASRERIDPGWRLVRVLPTGACVVRKHDVVRLASAAECDWGAAAASGASEGTPLGLRWPRESTSIQPTFYFAIGEAIGDHHDDVDLLKMYWHVTAPAAPDLVRLVTRALNGRQVPFRLKCLNDPAAYSRADAAVLFLSRRHYRVAAQALYDVHVEIADTLDDHVPLFSKRLARGLGLAEEPLTGESFGQHRCRMLAEAIASAHRLAEQDGGRLEQVARVFAAHGISLDTPYLNPGSVDRYEWGPAPHPAPVVKQATVAHRARAFLDTASLIGTRLCRDAIWAGARCNWVGAAARDASRARSTPRRACGPDLYGGTMGIALFLARLYRATGDPLLAMTAEGAIRQALSRVDDVAAAVRMGVHAGFSGIAYALMELSELLSTPKFTDIAMLILAEAARSGDSAESAPSASASAAAIPVWLHVHRRHSHERLLQHAIDLGRRIAMAPAPCVAQQTLALLDLWQATGDASFGNAARECLMRLVEPKTLPLEVRDDQAAPDPDLAFWLCEPPGSTVVAIRAHERAGTEHLLHGAVVALLDAIARPRSSSRGVSCDDFSLAGGVAGTIDLLLCVRRSDRNHALADAAEALGRRGIDSCAADNVWPCGFADGAEAPGLMTGLAGIGHSYLRLHDPAATPPVLILPAAGT